METQFLVCCLEKSKQISTKIGFNEIYKFTI